MLKKLLKKWKYKMWYYTKREAEQVAARLRAKGGETKIRKAVNLNRPRGGKYVYDVWYR